jgi:hypothetical protein
LTIAYFITGWRAAVLIPSYGLWPIVMVYIASQAYANPDLEVGICGSMVKNRNLALIYLVLLLFLARGSFVALPLAFLLGTLRNLYIEADGKLKCMELSDEKAERWAETLCCAWLTSPSNFISPAEAGPDELPFSFVQQAPAASPTDIPRFVPFRGEGQRVGGNENKYQRVASSQLALEETKDIS